MQKVPKFCDGRKKTSPQIIQKKGRVKYTNHLHGSPEGGREREGEGKGDSGIL